MPPTAVEIGPAVHLRLPIEADRAEWIALRRASAAQLEPWEPAPLPGSDPFGDDGFNRLLASCLEPNRRRFLVCRNDAAAVVGQVSINDIIRGVFLSASLGYWMGTPHTGKGFMSQAVRLVTRHAFLILGLHRLEINFIPGNEPSARVAHACGFRREGLSPRFLNIAGRWQDHERWALTVEDWAP